MNEQLETQLRASFMERHLNDEVAHVLAVVATEIAERHYAPRLHKKVGAFNYDDGMGGLREGSLCSCGEKFYDSGYNSERLVHASTYLELHIANKVPQ